MCERMTCWPDVPPAVNQEAPFPLTSFFPIGPTPVRTSQLHGENHMQRREINGGNHQQNSAINFYNANMKIEPEEKVNHTNFLIPNLTLPLPTVPQSPSSHPRTEHKNWIAPKKSQDCHLGACEQWGKTKTGRREGD